MLHGQKCIGTVGYMGGLPAMLSEFTWSYGQMVQFNAEAVCGENEYVHYIRSETSFHAAARNNLVDQMRGDWLLMLDTDHAFDPDLLYRMINRMAISGADVIVGLYQMKQHPYAPCIYTETEEGFQPLLHWRQVHEDAQLIAVDSAGAGCLLVKRSVFDRIRNELHESPFSIIHPFGEDHSFAKRCKKLGIKLVVDPRIECHHLQVRPLSMADYEKGTLQIGPEFQIPGFVVEEG